MKFWSWFVYVGLVAYCSSSLTTFSSAFATVYPSEARIACERNLNPDPSNATNLLSKSWLKVYSQEFLMLELHYRCSKSSRSSQGASGIVFDVIQVEAKHSRAIENICLDYQEESAHVILIYGGFNAYRMRALRTSSSERNCILLSSEFGLKTRFPIGQFCNKSIACKANQVCSNGECECDKGFYPVATHSSLECKDCATPFGENCTQTTDCYKSSLGYYSECVDHSYCSCRRDSKLDFDTGRCTPNFGEDYEMAVKVALGAAIIIAVGILLAILYNTVRQRALNTSTTTFTRQGNFRRSLDSLQRLVEGLLLDRPPPYTINNDKPPTYDEAVQDYEPSATDSNGNTTAIDMAVIPTVDDATPPPPYSMPYVNPAFEIEPTDPSVEEDPFAVLRIPTVSSQVVQVIAPSEMFICSSHLACSHL